MIESIVDCLEPVTLIGGGQATPEDLEIALTLAPTCIAADSGAHFAREAGVSLAAVIGDFDSVSPDVLAGIAAHRQHRIAEQDSTDFEKALTRITAPVVVGVGFTGGRVDHQLAAFHTLAAYPARRCVLLGPSEIVLLSPPRLALPTQAGDVISLFPLGPVQGGSTGLEWPIDGLAFDPLRQIGTSNRATGACEITMQTPDMLMILPRRLIRPVVAQLLRPDAAQWSARAG